jgi:hypothetical protein
MTYTISGSTDAGSVTLTRDSATEAVTLCRQFNAAGLQPIVAADQHGERITLDRLVALAELEDGTSPEGTSDR